MSIHRGAALTRLATDASLPGLCCPGAYTYSSPLQAVRFSHPFSVTRLNPLSPGVGVSDVLEYQGKFADAD